MREVQAFREDTSDEERPKVVAYWSSSLQKDEYALFIYCGEFLDFFEQDSWDFRNPDGLRPEDLLAVKCFVFSDIKEAETFGKTIIEKSPFLKCNIYDTEMKRVKTVYDAKYYPTNFTAMIFMFLFISVFIFFLFIIGAVAWGLITMQFPLLNPQNKIFRKILYYGLPIPLAIALAYVLIGFIVKIKDMIFKYKTVNNTEFRIEQKQKREESHKRYLDTYKKIPPGG